MQNIFTFTTDSKRYSLLFVLNGTVLSGIWHTFRFDWKKTYIATELGKKILKVEAERIFELYKNAKSLLEESI